ncbi:MAG: hypothetical protein ACFHHU_13090 [Porticoccaceae bacterium]
MSLSTKYSDQAGETSILRELDELVAYISGDAGANLQEDLIDPAFFIGDIESAEAEVPTLTSVAEELANDDLTAKTQRQPGLFTNRIEEIKRTNEQRTQPAPEPDPSDINMDRLVDALVAEYLPKLEAELREKIRAQLKAKK